MKVEKLALSIVAYINAGMEEHPEVEAHEVVLPISTWKILTVAFSQVIEERDRLDAACSARLGT